MNAAEFTPPAGMKGHVDHIGIAVENLDDAVKLYRDLLGLELEHVEEVPAKRSGSRS